MMLSFAKLRAAISGLLYDKFPQIRDGDDGRIFFDNVERLERPCFYVEIAPQRTRTFDAVISERSLSVDVHYFGTEDADGNIDRTELYDMADALDAAFRPVLYVADRAITINDAEMQIVDEVLHYIFTLAFADAFTEEEHPAKDADLMQILTLNIDKEEKPNGK